ncbi:hypothetical protein ES703_92087 [subsurface metagenome]
MDYHQGLTVPTGKVVNIKFANFYLFTVYFIYHLTPLTQKNTPAPRVDKGEINSARGYTKILTLFSENYKYFPTHFPSLAFFRSS